MLGRRRRVGAHVAADTDSWALPSLTVERVGYGLLLRRPHVLCLRIFGVHSLAVAASHRGDRVVSQDTGPSVGKPAKSREH